MRRGRKDQLVSSGNKSYIKKISDVTILGGFSAVLVAGLVGCDSGGSSTMASMGGATSASKSVQASQSQGQGVTVTLQEDSDGNYTVLSQTPSGDGETTIIVRDTEGNKRVLSKEEVDSYVAEEARRVDNGTSTLTSSDGGGLGIGGAILASAAGALLGSYIGNKLFNNQNFKNNAQRATAPSSYQRPATAASAPRSTSAPSRAAAPATKTPAGASSGFFGGNSNAAS